MDNQAKKTIKEKIEKAFLNTVQKALNEDKATERVLKLKKEYGGMPKDVLANILIKRAVRKTTIEGIASSSGISGLEAVLALPAPEPTHKAAAIAGIASLLATDITTTTAIQMQLALDLSVLYECPFYKNNEEDVWEILQLAIGLKGKEKVGSRVQFIFTEGAKKNFRKLLRNKQLRKRVQDWVLKKFGKEIAKLLSEKYLMRLIPLANIAIATFFNNKVTKAVGKYSKIKSKIRSSTFKNIDTLLNNQTDSFKWVLPIICYVGTINDTMTTNFISLYSQSLKRLKLTDEQENEITKIIDNDKLCDILQQFCLNCQSTKEKQVLFDIAVTTVATNLKPTDNEKNILLELSQWFSIEYSDDILKKKIKYFKK